MMHGHVPAAARNVALMRLHGNECFFFKKCIDRLYIHKSPAKPRFSSSCRDVVPPLLSSYQLPDVTFVPSATEAFFSSRRTNEDQHAGKRPFCSFHHLPLREKLREAQKILSSICTFVSRRSSWFAGQQSEFARERENNNLFIIYQVIKNSYRRA